MSGNTNIHSAVCIEKTQKLQECVTHSIIQQQRAAIRTARCYINRKGWNHLFSSAIIRAIYLPMMSNSRLTTLPSTILWKLVCSWV